jgi:hypothetical protein
MNSGKQSAEVNGKHDLNEVKGMADKKCKRRRQQLEQRQQQKRMAFLGDMMRDPQCWREVEM